MQAQDITFRTTVVAVFQHLNTDRRRSAGGKSFLVASVGGFIAANSLKSACLTMGSASPLSVRHKLPSAPCIKEKKKKEQKKTTFVQSCAVLLQPVTRNACDSLARHITLRFIWCFGQMSFKKNITPTTMLPCNCSLDIYCNTTTFRTV